MHAWSVCAVHVRVCERGSCVRAPGVARPPEDVCRTEVWYHFVSGLAAPQLRSCACTKCDLFNNWHAPVAYDRAPLNEQGPLLASPTGKGTMLFQ